MCTGFYQRVPRIKKEDIQTSMNEDFVMKVPSTNNQATQYAFLHSSCLDRLEEEIWGKIHIDMFGPVLAGDNIESPRPAQQTANPRQAHPTLGLG